MKDNIFYGMRKSIGGGGYGRTRGFVSGMVGDIFFVVDEVDDLLIIYSDNHDYGTVYTTKEEFSKLFMELR